MRKVIKSKISLLISFVGLIGGLIWAFLVKFEPEPIMLIIVSAIEIVGYSLVSENTEIQQTNTNNSQNQNVNVSVNVGQNEYNNSNNSKTHSKDNRTDILNLMAPKTFILFIDDDDKFNVVKILRDSGWKRTKTVIDVKTLDVQVIKESDIIFVDINGVGKLLNLEFEGLDLALMLKQKYPQKKVIIYSANRNSNSFHKAWDICDFKLEKNALPYQFQNLVEEYSIEKYNTEK